MKKEYILFLIFPISQFLMFYGDYSSIGSKDFLFDAGVFFSLIADVVLLFILVYGAKKEKIERNVDNVQFLNQIETSRNVLMEKQQKELFGLKMDLEKRIHKIDEDLKNGNIEDKNRQLEKFQNVLDKIKLNDHCNHAVVNAVLNEKEKACKSLGGLMTVNVTIPKEIYIEHLHICSVFSNLLDNAIEAISELDVAERWIRISAEIKGNYLFVKVENSTTKEHAERNRPKDRGYGTLILNDITKKYDGQYITTYENGCFSAAIMLKNSMHIRR